MTQRVQVTLLVNNIVGSFFPYPSWMQHVRYEKVNSSHTIAEHGLSMLVEVFDDPALVGGFPDKTMPPTFTLLWDVGSINETILHNWNRFRRDWGDIDAIALSHGHYDHAGALEAVLSRIPNTVPVYLHPDGLNDRYFKRSYTGPVSDLWGKNKTDLQPLVEKEAIAYFPGVSRDTVASLGGDLHLVTDSQVLYEHDGLRLLTTGVVPREHPQEPSPKFTQVVDGKTVVDPIWDDQALVIDLQGDQTVLLLGCGHAGLMNTITRAHTLAPGPISHIIGGTHMMGAGPKRTDDTLRFLQALPGKKLVFPLHCSGPDFPGLVNALGDLDLLAFDASVGTQFVF